MDVNDWTLRLGAPFQCFITWVEMKKCIIASMHNIQLKKGKRTDLCTDIDSHGPWFLGIAAFAVLALPYLGFCYDNRAKMHAKMTREGLISPCPPRCAVVKPPLFEKMTAYRIDATCRQIAAFCAVMHLEDSTRAMPVGV